MIFKRWRKRSACVCLTSRVTTLQLWMKICTRWRKLTPLWQLSLRVQWPENCRDDHSHQSAPQLLWCVTQMESVHWWGSPRGYGDMTGQVLTFDSLKLSPQLWINDSKKVLLQRINVFNASNTLRAESLTLYSTATQWQIGIMLEEQCEILFPLSLWLQLCVMRNRGTTVGAKVRLNIMCRPLE